MAATPWSPGTSSSRTAATSALSVLRSDPLSCSPAAPTRSEKGRGHTMASHDHARPAQLFTNVERASTAEGVGIWSVDTDMRRVRAQPLGSAPPLFLAPPRRRCGSVSDPALLTVTRLVGVML
jgi:hypothetical protein